MRKEICKIYDSLPSFDGAMDLGCNVVMESNDAGLWLKNTATGAIRQLQKGCWIFGFSKEDYNWDVIDHLENNGCAYSGEIRYGGIYCWDDFKDGFGGFTWTLHPEGRYYADEDGYGAEDDVEITICVILDSNLNVVVPWQPMDARSVLKLLRREELREILGEVLDSDWYDIRVELTDDEAEIRIVIEDENNSEYVFFMRDNDIYACLNDGVSMKENCDKMNMVNVGNGDSWEVIKAQLDEPAPMMYRDCLTFPSFSVPFLKEYCSPGCFAEAERIHDMSNEHNYGFLRKIYQDPFGKGSLYVNLHQIDEDKIFYWAEVQSSSEVVSGVNGSIDIDCESYIYAVVDKDGFLLVPFRTEDHYSYTEEPRIDEIDIYDEDEIECAREEECSFENCNYVFVINSVGYPIINLKKLEEIGYIPKDCRTKLLWPNQLPNQVSKGNAKKEENNQQSSVVINESKAGKLGTTEMEHEWILKLIEIEAVIQLEGRKVVRKLNENEVEEAYELVKKATNGAFTYIKNLSGGRGKIRQSKLIPWKELYHVLTVLPPGQCTNIILPFNQDFFRDIENHEKLINEFRHDRYIPAEAFVREDKYIVVMIYLDYQEESFDEYGYGGGTTDEYAVGIIDDHGRWALPLQYTYGYNLYIYETISSNYFVQAEKRELLINE